MEHHNPSNDDDDMHCVKCGSSLDRVDDACSISDQTPAGGTASNATAFSAKRSMINNGLWIKGVQYSVSLEDLIKNEVEVRNL
jgi:hypothetical protein